MKRNKSLDEDEEGASTGLVLLWKRVGIWVLCDRRPYSLDSDIRIIQMEYEFGGVHASPSPVGEGGHYEATAAYKNTFSSSGPKTRTERKVL